MGPSATRRTVLAGAAASAMLPFLRAPHARAATPGVLTFGLSSFPPSIQPWANTGTAAATVKLMIYRGLTSYAEDGSLRGELAESWQRAGATGYTSIAGISGVGHSGAHNGPHLFNDHDTLSMTITVLPPQRAYPFQQQIYRPVNLAASPGLHSRYWQTLVRVDEPGALPALRAALAAAQAERVAAVN